MTRLDLVLRDHAHHHAHHHAQQAPVDNAFLRRASAQRRRRRAVLSTAAAVTVLAGAASVVAASRDQPAREALAGPGASGQVEVDVELSGESREGLRVDVTEVRRDERTGTMHITLRAAATGDEPVDLGTDLVGLAEVQAVPDDDDQAPLTVQGRCPVRPLPTGELYDPCAAVRLVTVAPPGQPLSVPLVLRGTGDRQPKGTYHLRVDLDAQEPTRSHLDVTLRLPSSTAT